MMSGMRGVEVLNRCDQRFRLSTNSTVSGAGQSAERGAAFQFRAARADMREDSLLWTELMIVLCPRCCLGVVVEICAVQAGLVGA
jgi:hypothetical protein